MRLRLVLCCLFALVTMASTAAASNGTLNWLYQDTEYQLSTTNSNGATVSPSTALAMRDGGVWPVIFSLDATYNVQAYSLYPVPNQQMPATTYWHQIGANLLNTNGTNCILSAATSPNGSFGAVARENMEGVLTSDVSSAIVGSTSGGFGGAMSGVRAIAFNSAGSLIKGTATTVPLIASSSTLELNQIASSPTGNLGAIDDQGNYYEKDPVLGGWQGASLGLPAIAPGPTAHVSGDLAMDTSGRPIVVTSLTTSGSANELIASEFNVMTGTWEDDVLEAGTAKIPRPTVVADGKGGVGVAWVEQLTRISHHPY